MTKQEFQDRTKQFALDVFRFCNTLPKDQSCRIIGNQLRRSASSVGANYRAACRGQSRAAFISKLSIVEEEADECIFWLEMLEDLGVKRGKKIHILREEADQIVAMIVASKKKQAGAAGDWQLQASAATVDNRQSPIANRQSPIDNRQSLSGSRISS